MRIRNKTIKIALLSAIIVRLLAMATPAMADYNFNAWPLTTRTSGTVNGGVFIDGENANGEETQTLNSDVPNGTVKYAFFYTGVWSDNPEQKYWYNVTFNGNYTSNGLGPIHHEGNQDSNSNVWCSGYGKHWFWYNVTNLTNAGQTNTAHIERINYFSPNLYHKHPSEMLTYCLSEISQKIMIDHSYGLYEYTLYLYKKGGYFYE